MTGPDEARNSLAPTSVDLFAGAGGLTLGLKSGGFRTLVANDNWMPAIETLSANFPEVEVSADDVRDLTGEQITEHAGFDGRPTLVAGGPPCQGFTSAGARRASDDRNTLVREFARLVVEIRPGWFLFENVEGFLTMSDGAFVTDLLDGVIEAGYVVRLRKVNVANYGVPQLRKRVIALGRLRADPGFPSPTHHAFGAPGASTLTTAGLPLCPTAGDGLEGLPAATDSDEGPSGHRPSKVSEIDLERIRRLAPGQTMRDLPPELQHRSYARRANRRVSDGMPTERRGGAPSGLRRLRLDQPSKAITSAAQREFIHPTEDRPLTLRECARFQGFPDNFRFLGSRSEQATLIGNAIPPALGNRFAAWVQSEATKPVESRSGGLVEFHVTNGSGMSPTLRHVVERIGNRYHCGQVALWR